MSLKDRLQDDLRSAMRNKDEVRKATLRQTIAEIKNAEVSKRGEMDEDELLTLLRTQVKRRQETISELEKAGGRAELLAEEKAQIEVLNIYVPQMMGRDEVVAVAQGAVERAGEPGPQQFGQVMKEVMRELRGKADGKLVSEVVRELLK